MQHVLILLCLAVSTMSTSAGRERWTDFQWLAYSTYMSRLPEEVREAAAVFGRMGGKAAGRKMTKEARIARAKKAAQARWERRRKKQPPAGNQLQQYGRA